MHRNDIVVLITIVRLSYAHNDYTFYSTQRSAGLPQGIPSTSALDLSAMAYSIPNDILPPTNGDIPFLIRVSFLREVLVLKHVRNLEGFYTNHCSCFMLCVYPDTRNPIMYTFFQLLDRYAFLLNLRCSRFSFRSYLLRGLGFGYCLPVSSVASEFIPTSITGSPRVSRGAFVFPVSTVIDTNQRCAVLDRVTLTTSPVNRNF